MLSLSEKQKVKEILDRHFTDIGKYSYDKLCELLGIDEFLEKVINPEKTRLLIKGLMVREDLNIGQLADKANVSRTTLWHIEKNKVVLSRRILRKLVKALNTNIDLFLKDK